MTEHLNEKIRQFIGWSSKHDDLLKTLEVYLGLINDITGVTAVTHDSVVFIRFSERLYVAFRLHQYVADLSANQLKGVYRFVDWLFSIGLDVHIVVDELLPDVVGVVGKKNGHWVLVNADDELHEFCQRACE